MPLLPFHLMESLCRESERETEQFAVTAASGGLGPVVKKLTALLGPKYKLQEVTRQDIVSIKSALEPVHDLLGKLWGREDLDAACKDSMMEARELSYDMDDDIDSFTLDLWSWDSCFFQWEATDRPFKEFVERVKGVSKRCSEMKKTHGGATICNHNKLSTDPRALFLHKDASELVGMEEKKEELIRLLQEHEMVCIVGFAGMGKTTLADLVYQTIGEEFQCRAFVSVHLSPNIVGILGTILSQVTNGATSAGCATEPAAEEDIINDISIYLRDKRYLVIVDDVWHWEDWEVIRKALPKNKRGCKIIMTTRIRTIAEKCYTDEGAHVYKQSFSYKDAQRLCVVRQNMSVEREILEAIAERIVNMSLYCDYSTTLVPDLICPLAVICLSSAWAESHVQGDYGGWDAWKSHMLDGGFLSNPSMKPLVQSLRLGFDDLPVQVRTCLLYCSIYPAAHLIGRDCSVRKWIAQGFVSDKEVAQGYVDKLLSRNLLEPIDANTYRVHPVMLAFLACKAKEDNFVAYGQCNNAKQKIRRFSLYTDRYQEEDVSRTRCLAVVGVKGYYHLDVPCFNMFRNLRVLEIRNSAGLEKGHLLDICGLFWLRYLGLNYTPRITELLPEIGRLQNLETLDVSHTEVKELPKEIEKLQYLKSLVMADTMIRELPREIGKLQHLETLDISHTKIRELPREITGLVRLENLNVSWTEVSGLPMEFGKLQQLRTLDIRCTKVRELSCREVPNSSLNVAAGDDELNVVVVKYPLGDISSAEENCCREGLSILVLFNHFGRRCEVLPVPMHRIAGRHMNIPQWVKQELGNICSLDIRLLKLGEDDLDFLKSQMPNLQALQLRVEVLPQEPIAITGGGFLKLETFYVDCRLPRVITFKKRAMPELKHLEFKFYAGAASQAYSSMGITHLPCLEKVVFRCSEHYTRDSPGISAAIEIVRKEAVEHPNEINLWVNDDMVSEVFGNGARWISLADKAIIEQEIKEWEKESENRKMEIIERAQHIRQQRLLLSTAAERQRDKNARRAAIRKEVEERKKDNVAEPMYYLYVNVVKARDLPRMEELTGALDPFVEVKLGNFKGITRYLEKNNSNPAWRQTFAFSRKQLQYSVLEVTVKDKDMIKDGFVGRVLFDINEIPYNMAPDCPLESEWYRLEDCNGRRLHQGQIKLAVWFGTEADKAFPEAWHLDVHSLPLEGLSNMGSKLYNSPTSRWW